MKKLLSIALLTVCALSISERPAHAWVNSKFSIGLNWHLQSANNSTLWGLWRNGQIPGPEAIGPGPGGPPGAQPFPFLGAQNGAPPQGGGQQGAYLQGGYPQGAYPQGMPQAYPQSQPVAYPQPLPQNFQTVAPPLNVAQMQQYPFSPNMTWNSNPFQAVSYQPNYYGYGYGYGYTPNYYYAPGYSYEVPYYWYNNR